MKILHLYLKSTGKPKYYFFFFIKEGSSKRARQEQNGKAQILFQERYWRQEVLNPTYKEKKILMDYHKWDWEVEPDEFKPVYSLKHGNNFGIYLLLLRVVFMFSVVHQSQLRVGVRFDLILFEPN